MISLDEFIYQYDNNDTYTKRKENKYNKFIYFDLLRIIGLIYFPKYFIQIKLKVCFNIYTIYDIKV